MYGSKILLSSEPTTKTLINIHKKSSIAKLLVDGMVHCGRVEHMCPQRLHGLGRDLEPNSSR